MDSDSSLNQDDLQHSAERLRLIVESSPAAIVIADDEGRIVLINQQTENWFGYEREELLGQKVELLIPERFRERHRDDLTGFVATPASRPMGAGRNLIARRKDGSEFPVDISLHPMDTEEGILVLAHVVDLTDRQQAAEEMRLRHSMERLALLGQLAGGVAHEIRNPLGVIRNAAYYLQMVKDSLDEDAQESITEIQQEVDKASHIVGDLLDYARDSSLQKTVFDLAKRIRQLVDNRQPEAQVTIEVSGETGPVSVRGDAGQIDRILTNLIQNGRQASDEDDTIIVSLRTDAGIALIDVSDQGDGITDENRSRIFEPLFTTKAEGIGLGLAVSLRYAEQNGGTLELLERPGPGTTFRLTLPLAEPPTPDLA